MKAILLVCLTALMSANVIFSEELESYPNNRVGVNVHVLWGGHASALYERRLNDVFGLEMGATGGENFIAYGFSRLTHIGPYVGANLYITKIRAPHHLYISPSISVTFGRASISGKGDDNADRKDMYGVVLNGSSYLMYRYLFSCGLGIETGLGADVVSVVFPRGSTISTKAYFFPIPKIALGLSYAF